MQWVGFSKLKNKMTTFFWGKKGDHNDFHICQYKITPPLPGITAFESSPRSPRVEPTILAGVNLLSALKKKKNLISKLLYRSCFIIHFAYWLLSTYESGIFLIAIKNCTLSWHVLF